MKKTGSAVCRNGMLLMLGLLLLALPSETVCASSPWQSSSSALALTQDGSVLLTVNPDSNSVTLIAARDLTIIKEIPVGLDPRIVTVNEAGQRAYVANRGSGSIAVVDLAGGLLLRILEVGNRPYGMVMDPERPRLYVAEQGTHRVRVLDSDTLETLRLLKVAERPSGLAISQDGQALLVTHLLAPNLTTIDLSDLPATDGTSAGTTIALWPDSNLVQSVVLSPVQPIAYIPHTRSNTANRALTFDTTVFPVVSLVDLSTGRHLVGQQLTLDTLDPPGVGLPFDAALSPDGRVIWILNSASNDVTVVDLAARRRVAHIEVGANPRGIVISPDGSRIYVNNTLSGTVSVIDAASYAMIAEVKVTEIPMPPVLLRGKRLFHSSDDPRMSRAQWISCNTCHFEGEHDGRTWFFGFAGPRNTSSLLGMIRTYPLRWSGEWDESADSEFANRKENFGSGLIEGEMHCSLSPPDCAGQPFNQGRSYDLDCLAAFLDSLEIPLAPGHARGEPLTEAEQRGRAIFLRPELGCVTCHPPPLYTDHKRHDVGTTTPDEKIAPAFDTPTLLGLYGSAPYYHDASAATLYEALIRPSPGSEHDVRGRLSEDEIQELVAFLAALPYE